MKEERRVEIRKAVAKKDYLKLENVTKEELIEYIAESQARLTTSLQLTMQSV